jgi:hypothetical protein
METCNLHESQMEIVARIESKVDDIVTRQLTFISDVAYLKNAMDNGIRRDVREANCEVMELGRKIEKYILDTASTLQEVKDFKWFREMMNSFRNDLFKNLLKVGLGIIILLIALHTSDVVIKTVVKAIGG